jgi:uncharacterized protein (TIGR03000 family)
MSRVWFSVVLGAVALVALPGLSSAQHGGGHGGGGHGGGFHGGGFHGGGFHSGGFHSGGSHGGGFRGGGFHHSGFHHDGFHHDGFHRGFRTYYGYYPYYGYYDYPYSYAAPSYDGPSRAYDSGYYGSYGGVTSSYPDSYSSATAQPDTSAHVTVSVPADAEIWFDGTKTTSTGSVREYESPPLTPGGRYTYDVRVRWTENGHEVTQTQQVEVTAGTRVDVHFPVQH